MKNEEVRIKAAGLMAVSSFLLLPSALGQGARTTPGPPAPTFKTLELIEPRTLAERRKAEG